MGYRHTVRKNFSLLFTCMIVLISGCGSTELGMSSEERHMVEGTNINETPTTLSTMSKMKISTPIYTSDDIDAGELQITKTPDIMVIAPTDSLGNNINLIVENDLSVLIPRPDEIYPDAMYYLCQGCSDYIHNEEIAWVWGKAIADRYIQETGRIIGFSNKYSRGTWQVYAPETLTIELQRFETIDGAVAAIDNYNSAVLFPDMGWLKVAQDIEVGHQSLSIMREYFDTGGNEWANHEFYFRYNNLVGVIMSMGWPEDIVMDVIMEAVLMTISGME